MSYIVVKYGKDQEKLFNTNCKVINLLHCIKESCGTKDCDIDLAEESSGMLQFLPSNLHEHTNSLLITPKASYVLVRLQKSEDGSMEYIPMIDMSRSNFLVKLRSTRTKAGDPRKRSTDKKSREELEGGLTSSSSFISNNNNNNTPTTPNNNSNSPASNPLSSSSVATPVTPSSATTSSALNASSNLSGSANASASTTPTRGKTPTSKKESRKLLFPKIDGAIPADASDEVTSSASSATATATSSPVSTPPTKKKAHQRKSSNSLLEPIA